MLASALVIWLTAGSSGFSVLATTNQETNTINIEADSEPFAQFSVELDRAAAADLTVGTFILSPHRTSLTFFTTGMVVVLPQTGALVLIVDQPARSLQVQGDGTTGSTLTELDPNSSTIAGGSAEFPIGDFPLANPPLILEVAAGSGVVLEEGTLVRFASKGDVPTLIVFITITTDSANEFSID